jgi:BNR repeat protein
VEPNPKLHADAPIEVVEARTLFRSPSIRRRGAASLRRLSGGRLVMAFLMGTGPEHVNDGAVMLTSSDDDGRTWDEPFPIYAVPGWDSLPLGGLAVIRDDLIQLVVGRVKFDPSLGGDEPFAGWFMAATESHDGGASWSDVGPEITLFPQWTELYGASNPHRRSDGKLIWAVMGTLGRDREWQAAVTVSDAEGRTFEPPTVFAADPSKNFADTDIIRVKDDAFIAVIREMVEKDGWIAFSDDECRTWRGLRRVGFRAANVKLYRLRDGSILCAYRDEDPARHGVSVSRTVDGGKSWTLVGQLYSDRSAVHQPGGLCGYPDMVSLGDDRIAATLHTYPDASGRADLQFFILRDRS